MVERDSSWLDFPDYCKTTANNTYKAIYKKIAGKFKNGTDFVNSEMKLRRRLAIIEDNES